MSRTRERTRGLFIRVALSSEYCHGPSAPEAARTIRAEETTACCGRDDSGEKSEARLRLARRAEARRYVTAIGEKRIEEKMR